MEAWMAFVVLSFLAYSICLKLGEYMLVCLMHWRLDAKEKARYASLDCWCRSAIPFCDTLIIWRGNSLPNGFGRCAVCPTTSLINHSCSPNGFLNWDDKRRHMTVHVMRPIKKGDEITISYVNVNLKAEDRQLELRHKHRFTCTCPACSATEEALQASDKRRERIGLLTDGAARRVLSPRTDISMKEIEELLMLLDEEYGDPSYKGDVCMEAHAVKLKEGGDKVAARTWAAKGYKLMLLTKGASSREVQLAKHASSQ
ncbi:unnamed protein product [Polarella glacialis]|uniref:SET domain-containing protein n=1 Tax=Polarella glacialis TaxID=89957 RepID=A0A813M047_POLGL|nr:unnamed protein product [Polarella glacialis]CAE8743145.1 unnamed protein product [Polarella glacialis]